MSQVGTCTFTEQTFSSVRLLQIDWTSDASGNVSGFTSAQVYDGEVSLATVPGAAVSSYTIKVTDSRTLDVLSGQGGSRSTTVTEYNSKVGQAAASRLSVVISGAGNAKSGTAYLFIR